MHHAWILVCVSALLCHADFSKTTTATDILSINCPNEFSHPLKFCWFCGLKPKGKRVIAILVTLSKGLITQKLLRLEVLLQICCSATLSLAIRWYIVWSSIACHK